MTTGRTDDAYVFAPPERATLSVAGDERRFPVHRVYCVGRNYAAHAVEMGHDPDREPPFFFQKNPGDLIADAGAFPYPPASDDVHHEIELLVALKSGGADIAVEDALGHVYGYGVALDMTRRDLQGEMKKLGRPWEIGKAFEGSAPAGPIVPASRIGHPESGEIRLDVDGEVRQRGDLDQMIWKTAEMIAILSTLFTLRAGDVVLTGTPAGVGPVRRGQTMHGRIGGIGELRVAVV